MEKQETQAIRSLSAEGTLKWLVNRVLLFAAVTGPDLLLALGMTALLLITVISVGGNIRFFQASLGFPVGIMLTLIIYRAILKRTRKDYNPHIALILRDWLPFLLITFIYENLHDLSKHFYGKDLAGLLMNWDIVIFGVEPTLWAQKFYSPLLTDYMAFAYALYFVFPLVIMFFLSQKEKHFEFREMALALTFSFIMGFIGYVIWPTSPPRYFITEMFTNPVVLHGPILFDRLQAAWDGLSVIPCGAFPSLHVGISTVALLYAWKFRNFSKLYKWIYWIYIPLVGSLWISTVYLRHHWVIDIFAGWAVALISFFLSEYVLKLWRTVRIRYGLSV
jgi:membrane-associated phospholipid phosphatase